jgi:hypothetical protein
MVTPVFSIGVDLEDMEARMRHFFLGGIELNDAGASTSTLCDWDQVGTDLDILVGYTSEEKRHELLFTKSTRRGECGLNDDGTRILFPLFLLGSLDESGMMDEDVIGVIAVPVPTIMDKRFLMKMAYFVGRTCKDECHGTAQYPKWKCDWDWFSFRRNVLEPNREHIQKIMGLSDKLTDRVLTSVDYIIND